MIESRLFFSKSASAGWHAILSYKNKILVINVTQYPWRISITVCNFSSTKICSLSIHVKYFADWNPPVNPSSIRTSRCPSVRDQWPVCHAADVKSDRWRPPRPHKCRVTAGENCRSERVPGNLFPSREIYFPAINNPSHTYVLEQKLLLTAYRKSYMTNRLVPKWMTLTFV